MAGLPSEVTFLVEGVEGPDGGIPSKRPGQRKGADPFSMLPTSENAPSQTVWKFGVDPELGLRKRPRGVEGVSIGRILPLKKGAPDAFSYFPNSFSKSFGDVRASFTPVGSKEES